MLSGDAHSLALDDGTNSQYATGTATGSRGFVVAHAAPMDRRTTVKGGPYSHGIVRGNGQFGILDVEDDGSRVRVTIQGRHGFLPVSSMRLEFETYARPARGSRPAALGVRLPASLSDVAPNFSWASP
jgi:hypothetical protein